MVNRVGITGIFLVSGGVLFFLSYVLDLIYKSYGQQGQLEYLFGVLFSLLFAAVTLLGIGLWRLRAWKPPLSRAGRVGLYLSLVALAGFGVTAAAMLVSAVQTSQPPPEDIFWFFFLGLVLSVIGPILLGVGLRQVSWLGLGRLAPFAVAAGAVLAPFDLYPWHDIGLMVMGLSWTALGTSMLLRKPDEVES